VHIVIMSAQRNRTQCPNLLQLRPARRGIAAPSKSKRLQSYKTGITEQKESAGDNIGAAGRTFFSQHTTLDRSFAAALRSSNQQQAPQQQPQQSSRKYTNQDTYQISGQSVQAKNVNFNAMDDVFLALTMTQQIMTELSGAATEEKWFLS
jgi:hypothetical protein